MSTQIERKFSSIENAVAEAIRVCMIFRQLTQKSLAKRAEVSQTAVSLMFKRGCGNLKMLSKMAKALDYPISYLVQMAEEIMANGSVKR